MTPYRTCNDPRNAVLKAAEASHNAKGEDASRLELLLLAYIRDAFAKEGEAPVANMFAEKVDVEIASADLVKALVAIEGRPWVEMGKSGKPLTQNRLARMLGANRAYVFARLSRDGHADLIEKVQSGALSVRGALAAMSDKQTY